MGKTAIGLWGVVAMLLACALCSCDARNSSTAAAEDLTQLRLAFNVLHDAEADDYEVFVMNTDGSGRRNISNWKGVDWVYYAHGDRIYFISDRDTTHRKYFLYEMDADGNNVRKISRFLLEDSWLGSRRNATEFVVCSARDGVRHELYLIDRNGKVLRRLTDNDIYENDPYFSPDGETIVFRSKETGVDELWIMDADGGNRRQLTHYPADDSSGGKHFYRAGPPFWEPNRNVISFTSRRKGNYSIFTIRPDGSDLRQVTGDDHDAMWHAWSPGGQWLVFDGTDSTGNYDIYLMAASGGERRRLTTDPTYEQAAVFVRAPSVR